MNKAPESPTSNQNGHTENVVDLTQFTGVTQEVEQAELKPINRADAFIVKIGAAFAPVGSKIENARRWGVGALASGVAAVGVLGVIPAVESMGGDSQRQPNVPERTIKDRVDNIVEDAAIQPVTPVDEQLKLMLTAYPKVEETVEPGDGADAIMKRVNPHLAEGPGRNGAAILANRVMINEQIARPSGELQPGDKVQVAVAPVSHYPDQSGPMGPIGPLGPLQP